MQNERPEHPALESAHAVDPLKRELRRADAIEQRRQQIQKRLRYLDQDFALLVRDWDTSPESLEALRADLESRDDMTAAKVALHFSVPGSLPEPLGPAALPRHALRS